MIGAVSSASDGNVTALGSDLEDNAIAQHFDAVEDNASEKSVSDNNVLKDSGSTTVNNWGQLKDAINDGAVIELSGDDVYYAEGSGITVDSGAVTIDGKGHTIDAQRLNSRIFEINNGATLKLENLILKNALSNRDGGAIYSSGTLMVTNCTFTNNTATTENGGAIYNHEGTLKIVNSIFEKNIKYDRAIYNYGTEDDPFRLTIINTTMVEDKVCVNYEDNERRLDDKRDIDLLTTEVNAHISEVIYEGTPVLISVAGVDADFTGKVTVNITNTIYNTEVDVANGKGNTTLNLDINRYTARLKNFISLTEDAFERDDTKPYLEINFKVACNNSFSALEDMISKSTGNVTLNQDYVYDSKTDQAYMRLSDKTLAIYGNGHSISGSTNNGDTLFLIEDDSNVRMENITLENGHAQSRSHLGSQIRMGGAIFVSRSNLTIINSTLKNNKAEGGSGGAIYSEFSTLSIIGTNFTNNNAANGKNLYVQGGNGAYILNSIIGEEDIYNEPDWDNNDELAPITVLNDLNATLHIPNYVQGENASLNIIRPENFTGVANLTINNNPINNIQITNGQAILNLNLGPGQYAVTMTTPDTVYYNDSSRNITCTYLAANTTSNQFIVKRVVDVQVTVQNITYGETETINVAINATGNITIRLNGENITNYTNVAYDKTDYPIYSLKAGDYTVEVIYHENDFAVSNSDSANFTVLKANSTLEDVNDIIFDYNSTGSTTLSFTGASGAVAEVVNQSNAIVDVSGNVITVSGLDAGNYTLTVTTVPDDNHNAVTKTASIRVSKVVSEVKIDVKTNYNVGESFDISITNNTVAAVTINDEGYDIKNGKIDIDTTTLKAGTYNVVATIVENTNYLASSANATFTISKITAPEVVIDVENSVVEGADLVVNVTVGDATGIVNINGVNITLSNGKASTTIDNVKVGDLTVNVTYFGDDKYLNSFNSAIVNVYAKKDANLIAVVDNIKVGEIAIVNVEIDPNVAGKVTVDDNEVSISNGKGTYNIPNLAAGNYSVVVRFAGDNYFNAIEKTVSFSVIEVETPANDTNASTGNVTGNNTSTGNGTVNNGTNATVAKLDSNLSASVLDVNVGETAVVNVSMDKNITGKVVVTFNGADDEISISNGKGSYSIPDLAAGSYSVVVRFAGDDYFNASEYSASFRVIEVETPANDTNASTGNGTDSNSTSGNATGNNTSEGNVTDNNNTSGNSTVDPEINKIVPTKIIASSKVTVVYGGKYTVATLNDSNGTAIAGVKVTVKFSNGKTATATTDKDGKVKVTMTGLVPLKTYKATITFAGNSEYAKSTKTVSVVVKKATPKLSAVKKTFKRSVKTKKYTVTLKNNQNKVMKNTWVTLKVNKKTYKVKTNSKGQATFKITNLKKKGTFIAVVKYAGSKYYNAKTVKPKITVK